MEDWEDVQVPPLLSKEQPKNKWDDEDVDEDDVKESWEDEDEPAPVREQHTQLVMENGKGMQVAFIRKEMLGIYDPEGAFMQSGKTCAYLLELSILFKRSGSLGRDGREYFCGQGFIKKSVQKCDADIWDADAPLVKPLPEKAPKKSAAKSTEKKGKGVQVLKEEKLDPLAEKLRQQRLVEEADFRSTTELFAKKGDVKSLDSFIPKSESDFLEYAELISHKLRSFEKSYHYIGLLKAIMRLSMTAMKAADAKEVSASVSAIANEKIKAEKEANVSKKKQAGKKKQLHVDKPDDDLVVNPYDALDDVDFM